ncbi:hypothetical protein BaRGS_00012443 [Batillaria attramentaria]|uniref:UV-stimulated scaffold protein A n=1 Tax=Batillaria attramentaria TaxID=370345 RepID=A0ABD0LAP7_9CAEN
MSEAGEGCLDHELSRQMAVLVEQLTTSGSPSLDVEVMKKLKRICRTSDLYVEHAFRLLMTQLEKGHAEIRLSTFQIIDELFNRSHAFQTDQDQPLPPPKAAAQKLRADTLKAVQQWHEKYSSGYKKLALGFNYLKTCKHVCSQ